MMVLPFVPNPNPDEILGSWLARVALHNGRGAWRAVLEDVGLGRKIESPVFDMVPHNGKLEGLLHALGTGYERAMLELTTLPYWLTFDAVEQGVSSIPGMPRTPSLSDGRGGPRSSMPKMGIGYSGGRALSPRFCPECLKMDFETCGEPYWHRTHQILNVVVCHLHGVPLRSKCPKCDIPIALGARSLIPLPRMRCECGSDLCVTPPTPEVQENYLKLAKLSAQALARPLPYGKRLQIRGFFLGVLRHRLGAGHGRYLHAIQQAFGNWAAAKHSHSQVLRGSICQYPDFILRKHLCVSRAPEYCALMAALDLGFSEVAASLVETPPPQRPGKRKRVPTHEWTTQSAKDDILRRVAERPTLPRSLSCLPYWFLRLNEPQWLAQTFSTSFANPIPSVEKDRADLMRRFADTTVNMVKCRHQAMQSPAGLRARLRDLAWLDDCLAMLKQRRTQHRHSDTWAEIQTRAIAIQQALEQMLKTEERPERIFATSLAVKVGLSCSQITRIIQATPSLSAAIRAANSDKMRRQVLWAARQLKGMRTAIPPLNALV